MHVRALLVLGAALVQAGACMTPAPRHGGAKHAAPDAYGATGKRKIIDLDELAVTGVATKALPEDSRGEAERPGLTRASIRAVVLAHQAALRACYAQGLARDPSLAGTVVVRFEVDAQGAVQAAAIQRSTLGAPEVAQCVVQAFARMPFPRPADRTTVVYPVTFRAAP